MSHASSGPPLGVKQFKGLVEWIEGFGINAAVPLSIIALGALYYLLATFDFGANRILSFIVLTSPLWLPFVLFYLFFEYWMYYVKLHFKLDQGRVSLEIKLPQEISKSPAAMEVVLAQLWQTASPDNHIQTYWDGKHPPTFGLELISTEGEVRFIINTPRKKFKNMVETYMYSQYPGIEIRELPYDYTAAIQWNPDKFKVFSLHFGLKKPDVYPIKTYIDYGLDKDPKEEFKIDPITPMLEFLGSIGKGEHVWVQYLISVHRETNFQTGSLGTHPDWKDDITKEIEKIMDKKKAKPGEEDAFVALKLTDNERDLIKALERSRGKYAFKTYMRTLYAAENDKYLPGERIGPIITNIFPFADLNRNNFNLRWRTDFNWNWWQDPSGKRREHYKHEELIHYKFRKYEGMTVKDTGSILTVEELATMFHLPGAVVTTPNLVRIPSARGEAPLNLPTE